MYFFCLYPIDFTEDHGQMLVKALEEFIVPIVHAHAPGLGKGLDDVSLFQADANTSLSFANQILCLILVSKLQPNNFWVL